LGGGYLWGTLTHRPASAIEFSGTVTGTMEVSVQVHVEEGYVYSYPFDINAPGIETYTIVTFDNGEQMWFGPRDAGKLVVGGCYGLKLKAATGPIETPVWRIVGITRLYPIATSFEPRH
jgi:hypothetical protein